MAQNRILKIDRPPGAETCLVADSPHSGRVYPADFGHACSLEDLRQAEDSHVDSLFDFLPGIGVPLLQAEFPRSYVDPNRPDDVTAQGPSNDNYVPEDNGLLRGRCTPRRPARIYDRPLTLKEAFNRVAGYYAPYHAQLKNMLDAARARHGKVVHLNLHSMPSTLRGGTIPNRYDVILGTRHDKTAAPELLDRLRALFEAKGYAVGLNVRGFEGGEIARRYGDPAQGRHSLQIEINRGLYLDEKNLTLLPAAAGLKRDLREILESFADFCAAFPPPVTPEPAPRNPCV